MTRKWLEQFFDEGGRISITPYVTRGEKDEKKNGLLKFAFRVATRMDAVYTGNADGKTTIAEILEIAESEGRAIVPTPHTAQATNDRPFILAYERDEDDDDDDW